MKKRTVTHFGIYWRDWALGVRVLLYPWYHGLEFRLGPVCFYIVTVLAPSVTNEKGEEIDYGQLYV